MSRHSGVFKDMIVVGQDEELPKVPMAERSEVLEVLLPFCLLNELPRFKPSPAGDCGLIKALDKYDVSSSDRSQPTDRG